MFRIKMLSGMVLTAALGLTVFSGPALARGGHGGVGGLGGAHFAGGYGGYFGAARYGLGPTFSGSYLPYNVPGSYGYYGLGGTGLGGYGLGRYGLGGYGLGGYGLGSYGLGSYYGLPGTYLGQGYGGYGLGLRFGLGRYMGLGVANPGSYYSGSAYGNGPGNFPYTPQQPYGDNHPSGNGVYNYGGANPDFRQSMYGPSATAPAPAREEAGVAHLQVVMPAADAQLWVNDTRTRQQGTDRAFVSPSLKPGKKFAYELKAVWTDRGGRQVEETRSITVQAGDRQVVDFTRPPAEQQGRPAPERLEEQPPAPQDQPPAAPVPPDPQERPAPPARPGR